MKYSTPTYPIEVFAPKILRLFKLLPSDVKDRRLEPWFALTRKTPKGSVGGWALCGVAISTRLIEASALFGGATTGRIEILQKLDRRTTDEIRSLLSSHADVLQTLKDLASTKEFRPLHRVLRQPGLKFEPVASEILSLLNLYFPAHHGMRAKSNRGWEALRTGVYAAFERVDQRVAQCLQPSYDTVRIRGWAEKKAA